jgi:hypothetical protein
VKNPVSKFAFQVHNLRRYMVVSVSVIVLGGGLWWVSWWGAVIYTAVVNPADPYSLNAPGFNP